MGSVVSFTSRLGSRKARLTCRDDDQDENLRNIFQRGYLCPHMLFEQPSADQPYQRDQAESRCPEVGLADITTDEDELFKGRDRVAVDVLRQA
jgi:hypothetical protein